MNRDYAIEDTETGQYNELVAKGKKYVGLYGSQASR